MEKLGYLFKDVSVQQAISLQELDVKNLTNKNVLSSLMLFGMVNNVFAMMDFMFKVFNVNVMEWKLEIDVIDVLIDPTLNGDMVNVDVKMDIHYSVLSVLEIKLVMINLKIVMLVLSMITNKEDVYHVQLDAWVVKAAINVSNVDHSLTLMQLQSFVQNIVEMD